MRKYPAHAALNTLGLSVGFASAILIMFWIGYEISYDRFHSDYQNLYKVITHASSSEGTQTYDVAAVSLETRSLPGLIGKTVVSTGNRWPHELCFKSESKPDECQYLSGAYADPAFLEVFSFPVLFGQSSPLSDPASIILSKSMAKSLFGDENPIGKVLQIDSWIDVKVTAVLQDVPVNSSLKFDFVMPFAILQKLWGMNDEQLSEGFFQVFLRAEQELSLAHFNTLLNEETVMGPGLKSQGLSFEAFPFKNWHLNSKFEDGKNTGGRIAYVRLFCGIALLIILMAVINFVNMATARASLRAKEIGIRKVIGAHKTSLIIQFLAESLAYVLLALVISLMVTYLALPYFNTWLQLSLSFELLTLPMWMTLLAAAVIIGILAGSYPALVLSSYLPSKVLKGQSAAKNTGSLSLRKTLIVVQMTTASAILLFGLVVYSQIDFIKSKNLGFDRTQTLRIEPTYKVLTSYEAWKDKVLSHPGVIATGASDSNPLDAEASTYAVSWEGKEADTRISFQALGCSADFPETIGITLLDGRSFQPDKPDHMPREAILSASALKMIGFEQAIGKQITINNIAYEIVGIADDIHTSTLHREMEPAILYRRPVTQVSALFVKYQQGMDKEALLASQEAFKTIEPGKTMKYWFQDESFHELYKTETLAASLVSFLTIVGVSIMIFGILGLSTFYVMRKRKEMGVRRVFGASSLQILRLLFGEFASILALSFILASILAYFAAGQWLKEFAFRTEIPWIPSLLFLLAMAMLVAGIISIQARKLLKTNPRESLLND